MKTSQQQIVISGENFLEGYTMGQHLTDGLFQYVDESSDNTLLNPTIGATNLWAKPGILYPQNNDTIVTTADAALVDGHIIAKCKGDFYLGARTFYLTSTGKIYSDYGGGLTFIVQDTTANRAYTEGSSDMVVYNYNLYISSSPATNKDIIKIPLSSYDGTYTSGADYVWWTTTKGKTISGTYGTYTTPLLVWENSMWIGDGSKMHRYTDLTGLGYNDVLVLNSDNIISALGIDPNSGKMMIATSLGANGSMSGNLTSKMLFWDGISSKPYKSVPIDGTVSAIYAVAGTIYLLYGGENLGYWNGVGISFIRKMKGYEASTVKSKHVLDTYHNMLIIVDGAVVLAYGSIAGRAKTWYVIYNPRYSNNFSYNGTLTNMYITCVAVKDNETLTIASTATGTIGAKFYFLKYVLRTGPTASTDISAGKYIKTKIFNFENKLIKVKSVRVSYEYNNVGASTSVALTLSTPDSSYNASLIDSGVINKYNNDRIYYFSTGEDAVFYDFYLTIDWYKFYCGIRKIVINYDIIE